MTREQAAGYLADAYQSVVPDSDIAEMIRRGEGGVVSIDIAKAAIIRAADAEAAAMRERAAMCAEDYADHYFGGSEGLATAIRAMPTTEVGK